MSPPVNNIGGANQHTKSKIWVETLLALVIGIDIDYTRVGTFTDYCVSIMLQIEKRVAHLHIAIAMGTLECTH